jgi:hypothetical protein
MPHLARYVVVGDSITDSSHDRSDPVSPGEGHVRLRADALAGCTGGLAR